MFGGLWDSFIRFKAAQGVGERTLSDYEVRVKKLFLSRFPTGDAQELRDSVLLFLSEPAAPATFNLKVAYLKVFFAWARDSGVDVGDPPGAREGLPFGITDRGSPSTPLPCPVGRQPGSPGRTPPSPRGLPAGPPPGCRSGSSPGS